MKHRLALVALAMLMSVVGFAQRVSYNVIASVPYDAQTQQYGKLTPLTKRIVKDGDKALFIGADRYDLLEVTNEVDEATIKYKEYTAVNAANEEYTIKVAYDGTARHAVMTYFVILINNNDIYHWTYYYTEAPTAE